MALFSSILGALPCTYAPEVARRSAAATAIDEKVAGNSSVAAAVVEAAVGAAVEELDALTHDANAADLRERLRPAASRQVECRAASVAPALSIVAATIAISYG